LNTQAVTHDLFPECPKPAIEKPLKAKRAAKSTVAARAPASLDSHQVQSAAAAATLPTGPDDWEAWAGKLEAHGDYRVQRRLKPVLHWPGEPGGPVVSMVLLDTETTGLDCTKERIIELAMLRVDIDCASGKPVGPVRVYDELEDPGKPIPPEVVALTGIQDDDVRGKKLDEARILAMLDGVDIVVAHNAGFDRPFVESRLPAFGRLAWACSFADIDWKAQGRGSAKLESLAQAHGWFYDAHRAEMDCHALLAVLAQALPQASHTGLAHLLKAVSHTAYALQATNAPFEAKDKLKARGYRWNADQRVWHTRLKDEAALEAECAWMKEHVFGQRRALVQVEKLDALVRFSSRPGIVSHVQL